MAEWACPGHVVIRKDEQNKANKLMQVACNDTMKTLEGGSGLRPLAFLFLVKSFGLGTSTRAGALLSTRTKLFFRIRSMWFEQNGSSLRVGGLENGGDGRSLEGRLLLSEGSLPLLLLLRLLLPQLLLLADLLLEAAGRAHGVDLCRDKVGDT